MIESMGVGTNVWVYLNDDNDFVGFGSLGKTRWKNPNTNKWMELAYIPMLGVHKDFHGRGYGREIVELLYGHAYTMRDKLPVLALRVDPANTKAIGLYTSVGFVKLDNFAGQDRLWLHL